MNRYKEGEAILRMKQDMQHGSPQFWDLVAYRVLYTPHFRTGSEWCIYPTYDYTHCLVDSFEDITHSLCTTEFRLSRESYYWLVDALEVYKPVQWEYGRLNITNTVLSKRKLAKLVELGLVDGWDDPRLYTLPALRRRGFTPESINAFVRELGVTTSVSTIEVARLENMVRTHLDEIAPRIMAVLEPLKVVIEDIVEGDVIDITVPNKPRDESAGTHTVPFTREIYIDASDFRERDDSNFFRLAPGKSVGLLYTPYPIECVNVIKAENGSIVEIRARQVKNGRKPKTYIQWVGEAKSRGSPIDVTMQLYEPLFEHSNPMDKDQVPGGWLSDVRKDSKRVCHGKAEIGLKSSPIGSKYQFIRIGYFCVDSNTDGRVVVNRTVTLKEDASKRAVDLQA